MTARRLVAAAFAAAALFVLAVQAPFVAAEARTAAALARAALPGQSAAVGPMVWVGIGTPQLTGLRITALCSTIVLACPVLLLGAALAAGVRNAALSRVVAGVAAALAIVVAANQARYLLLAWLATAHGHDAFLIGHHWIGSLGVLACFGFALFLTVRIASSGAPRTAPAPRAASATAPSSSAASEKETRS